VPKRAILGTVWVPDESERHLSNCLEDRHRRSSRPDAYWDDTWWWPRVRLTRRPGEKIFMNERFASIRTTTLWFELGGALKNVIAIARHV